MTEAGTARGQMFSARVVIALLIVGVFSFSAFVTLSTFAPDFNRGDNGAAHALSRSAVGFAGAVELARSLGTKVSIDRAPRNGERLRTLTILTPQAKLTREQIKRLSGLATLVILPKWVAAPLQAHPGWVSRITTMDENSVADILGEIAPHTKISRAKTGAAAALHFNSDGADFVSGAIAELQSVSPDDLDAIVTAKDGRIILGETRQAPGIYVLADPDFLNTQGLADLATARVGIAMLDVMRDGEPIAFDVTLNGLERARNLLRLALTPPLLGATLALFAAAALLAWRAVMQSGPRVRPGRAIALGKRALAENSAALIRLARREYTMGWRYAVLTAASAAEQIGAPRTESAETFAMLDRVGATQGLARPFSTLASEAAHARNSAEVVTAARRLYSWTEEMLRATR